MESLYLQYGKITPVGKVTRRLGDEVDAHVDANAVLSVPFCFFLLLIFFLPCLVCHPIINTSAYLAVSITLGFMLIDLVCILSLVASFPGSLHHRAERAATPRRAAQRRGYRARRY
ncbi:hypothetical protein B0H66DRAFT_42908 [Apodospora peruviana]|uniref:Uncharacterized protein n=1 Tax=Apodospora peruviana TaxID=516989 RepID=A0AAE0ISY6_9PEZI|nr:hypothetical protein B0H66DRAFT_42908 [Apodospora peruviana]